MHIHVRDTHTKQLSLLCCPNPHLTFRKQTQTNDTANTPARPAGAPVSEAVSRYQAAAALCPCYAPALYNLGVVAGELRQADAAVEYYRAAIAAEPRYAQVS